VQVDIICKKDSQSLEVKKQEIGPDGLTTVLTIEHKKGCPVFNVSSMARFLAHHSYLFGAALILVGAFLCLFGRVMIGIAIFIVSASTAFLIGTFLTFNGFDYFEITPPNVIFWVIIGSWTIAGIIVGTLFYKL